MGNVPKKLQLLKPLPGGGGGGKVSIFDVVISTDANGVYTTDKTLTQIVDAHDAGNVVRCQYNHDDITITTGVAQVVSSNGQHCAICQAFDADGNQAYFFIEETGITLVPYSGGSGESGEPGEPGEPGQNGKSAYEYAKEAGYTGTEEEFAAKLAQELPTKLPNPYALSINGAEYDGSKAVAITTKDDSGGVDEEAVKAIIETKDNSVKAYGAKGDGESDDTKWFQAALAENRKVTVPGGTYKLSGELVIRHGCELVLSIDTVLDFTQTSGNCITLNMSSSLRGNHATTRVPYTFDGNVVYVSSTTVVNPTPGVSNTSGLYYPDPFNHWDPQWKHSRYLTDLNIVKPDARGTHTSFKGDCYGNAVYISADNSGEATYIWGLDFSGLRIAGGFKYGVRAVNFNSAGAKLYAWNHEMRISGVIENCEIGVGLERCNNAYVSVIFQPRYAEDFSVNPTVKKKYAKHGIELKYSTNADLSGSRVWDWNENGTLWSNGNQWQHIGMYGDCHGAIINAYQYYDEPSLDIRDMIYTDTPSNLEKLVILQEPFTRWFKPKENEPYFFNGDEEKRLALMEDVERYFEVGKTIGYTDALANAIDTDKTIYNKIGYSRSGGTINSSGQVNTAQAGYYGHTGFIACKQGSQLTFEGLKLTVDGDVRVVAYDANFAKLYAINAVNIVNVASYYFPYTETENGFQMGITNIPDCAYIRIGFLTRDLGQSPTAAVDEEIRYVLDGYVADGIKVKGESLVLHSSGGKAFTLTVSDTGALTANEIIV